MKEEKKNELIEKYVYAVESKLPAKLRKDVGEELRANIMDMLPDKFGDKDVEKVLTDLGNPSTLANNYSGNKKYLISPKMYDSYMQILKLVLVIVFIIILIGFPIATILELSGDTPPTVGRILLDTLGISFGALTWIFTWVTIIFAILDRKLDTTVETWTVKDLEDIPEHVQDKKPSKIGSLFEMGLAIVPALIIIVFPNILGWYDRIEGSWEVIPVFSEAVSSYIPIILITTIVAVIATILKMTSDKCNVLVVIANSISNILTIVASIMILTSDKIFNNDFVDRFNSEVILNDASNPWNTMTLIILAIIIIISVTDTITHFVKLKNNRAK